MDVTALTTSTVQRVLPAHQLLGATVAGSMVVCIPEIVTGPLPAVNENETGSTNFELLMIVFGPSRSKVPKRPLTVFPLTIVCT
jgi:hypothetical protein